MKLFLAMVSIIVAVTFTAMPAQAAYMVGSYCATQIVDAQQFIAEASYGVSASDFWASPIWVLGNGPYPARDVFYKGWGTLDPTNCPVKVFGFQDKDRMAAPETGDSTGAGADVGSNDGSNSGGGGNSEK